MLTLYKLPSAPCRRASLCPAMFGRTAAFAAVFLASFLAAAESSVAADRPNIVFVIADDLGYGDLASFGHPEIKTPVLDQLAADGMRFTHNYSAAPQCSPARAGIMTGRIPARAGIYKAIPTLSPMHLREGEVTIAGLLKESGYATALVGKWHLNGMFNLPGQPQPDDHGFAYWFSVQNNALPNHHKPYNFVRNGIPTGPIEGYAASIVADEAVHWLTRVRDRSKPFFLYVPFNEPHEPIATDPRHRAHYEKAHPDDPSRVAYYGNVTQMDAALGRILRTLETQGLANNTLVWFTSDNGPARTRWHNAGSSGGFREYKSHLYEGGIRVPGIVRWPGRVRPGSTSAEPVSGVDVLPTLCDVTGLAAPTHRELDGISILPAFQGRRLSRTKPLYWQFVLTRGTPQVAIRQGSWKLLASFDAPRVTRAPKDNDAFIALVQEAGLTGFELYDLENDPGETTDLVQKRPDQLAQLKAALNRLHASVQADAPAWPPFDDPGYEQRRIEWPDYLAKPLPPKGPHPVDGGRLRQSRTEDGGGVLTTPHTATVHRPPSTGHRLPSTVHRFPILFCAFSCLPPTMSGLATVSEFVAPQSHSIPRPF